MNNELLSLYKAKKIMIEMLNDRNYYFTYELESLDDFMEKYNAYSLEDIKKDISFFAEKYNKSPRKLTQIIFLHTDDNDLKVEDKSIGTILASVKLQNTKSIVNDNIVEADVDKDEISKLILVCKNELRIKSRNKINSFYDNIQKKSNNSRIEPVNIKIFIEIEIQTNITKHELQPKFRKLQKEEVKKICSQFKISYSSKEDLIDKCPFSKMFVTDKIARYYDYKVGDIIEITRPSFTIKNGISLAYRIVVNQK